MKTTVLSGTELKCCAYNKKIFLKPSEIDNEVKNVIPIKIARHFAQLARLAFLKARLFLICPQIKKYF